MNQARFEAAINDSKTLLNSLELFLLDNPIEGEIDSIAATMRRLSQIECWRTRLQESLFRILLVDYSFFSFSFSIEKYSMTFHQCPFNFPSYPEYLMEIFGEDWAREKHDPENRTAYEEALDNAPIAPAASVFRFDFEPKLYIPGLHPAGHLHAGHETEVRIGSRVHIDPLAFTCFIIRQLYKDRWQLMDERSTALADTVRPRKLAPIDHTFFREKDLMELHLGPI